MANEEPVPAAPASLTPPPSPTPPGSQDPGSGEKPPAPPPAETPPPAPPAPPPVPEKYELKPPVESYLSENALSEIAEVAKAEGLTQKQAQALVERESKALGFSRSEGLKALETKSKEWVEELKKDKEIGGEEFTKNVELASRVVARYGSDELKSVLDKTGFGNHPELVRVFARIAKQMSEDQLIIPGAQGGQASKNSGRSLEDIFYGSKPIE